MTLAPKPIHGALARAVAIVEELLGGGVIDRDDGKPQRVLGSHRSQSRHAGRGLFGATTHAGDEVLVVRVDSEDQVGAVIEQEVRRRLKNGLDPTLVVLRLLAETSEDGDPVLGDESGRDFVLRRALAAGAERHVGAAFLEDPQQIRHLAGDVETGAYTQPGEWFLFPESTEHTGQNRHALLRPIDPPFANGGQTQIGDVRGA